MSAQGSPRPQEMPEKPSERSHGGWPANRPREAALHRTRPALTRGRSRMQGTPCSACWKHSELAFQPECSQTCVRTLHGHSVYVTAPGPSGRLLDQRNPLTSQRTGKAILGEQKAKFKGCPL